MEDRLTPVLYLEMTDAAPTQYAAERVSEVLGHPGALVEDRIGPWGSPECQARAGHPSLRIMYVNSFALAGERAA